MAYIDNPETERNVLYKIGRLERAYGWTCTDYGHAWSGYFIEWDGVRQEFKTLQAFYVYLNDKLKGII